MNPEAIPTEPVESSNIQALGFDWPTGTLSVVFKARTTKKKGLIPATIYHYAPVPKPLYESLRKAKSIGGYFTAFIRNSPSIRGMLWCDCGEFSNSGEHLAVCEYEIRTWRAQQDDRSVWSQQAIPVYESRIRCDKSSRH